jgi:glycosyltransferase involved in cell wall biosynthesis
LLTNAPSPYQLELFASIHRLGTIDLQVRFMRIVSATARSAALNSGIKYRELWGAAPRHFRDEFRPHPRAIWEAAFGRFDCFILSGIYTSVTFLICAAILTLRGKPWAVWLERPHTDKYQVRWGHGRIRTPLLQTVKRRSLRFVLRRATCVIGMGSVALREYRDLGVAGDRLTLLPYCCDVKRFAHVADEQIARVHNRYRLAGKTVFLFSGQMIERKGVSVLLRAFERVAKRHANVALLLLGDGPAKGDHERSLTRKVRDRVHFAGFLGQQELPAHFAAADVFVFPSRHDGWGVVLNEACASRLPIIASRQTGAAFDLVEDNGNGFLLDCEDVEGFAAKMQFFVEHFDRIKPFGQRSWELVQPFSSAQGAKRFRECVVKTIGTGGH